MAWVKIRRKLKTVTREQLKKWLPIRPRTGHKGDFGKILLLCGAVGYTGAPVLAARAALRTGAGLVYLGVPEPVYSIVAGNLIEPVVFPLPSENGTFSEAAIPAVLERLENCDACLIGCGMGKNEDTFALVQAVLEQATCPVVLDADGINVLQGNINILRGAACPVILTPHEGEFARLGGDLRIGSRLQAVKLLQKELNATLLLKGHRTLICGEGESYVNCCGNPGMATGGSGDALAGLIVSLLGQGLSPVQAAAAGAWLHGTAGDLCARRLGEYGMLSTDLIEELPRLLK